jgi:hypothetical protein
MSRKRTRVARSRAAHRHHAKQMEGDNTERRNRAREARESGRLPSAEGVSLGAGKQREETRENASHQERIDRPRSGKRGAGTSSKPRPGNRRVDPKRTSGWE